MKPAVKKAMVAEFGAIVTCDEVLAPLTTYRLGGPAAVVARPSTVTELLAVGNAAANADAEVLVVGRGSNLLVADSGFDVTGVDTDATIVASLRAGKSPMTAEEFLRGTPAELLAEIGRRPRKGEFVVVVEGNREGEQ